MAYYAVVHTDRGEQFKLLHEPASRPALGTRLLGLLTELSSCHTHMVHPSMFVGQAALFSQWAGEAIDQILATTRVLNQSWYGGNFSPSECEWILRVVDTPELRVEWEKTYKNIQERWVNVEDIVTDVRGLLTILAEAELEPTDWYEPDETFNDVQALMGTLLLAKSRGAWKVTIQIE